MRYRERITFLTTTATEDGAGGTIGTFAKGFECWANISTDALSRTDILQQTVNMVTVSVDMRFNTEFTPESGNQFVWRERLCTIHGPIDLGEKRTLKFKAAYDAGRRYDG